MKGKIECVLVSLFVICILINCIPIKAAGSKNDPMYLESQSEITGGTWVQAEDGRWWFRYSDGSYPRSRFLYIDGYCYYFDSNGWMLTGWQIIGSSWYYFTEQYGTPPKGSMATGVRKVNGNTFFFSNSGGMQTGWQYYTPGYIEHGGYKYNFEYPMWVLHD